MSRLSALCREGINLGAVESSSEEEDDYEDLRKDNKQESKRADNLLSSDDEIIEVRKKPATKASGKRPAEMPKFQEMSDSDSDSDGNVTSLDFFRY